MARFPAPNLPVAYTDQTATSSFVGCHNPNGSLNVTFVTGSTYVGAYARNGSLNVTTDVGVGIRNDSGALRVSVSSGFLTLNLGTGGSASAYASYPAPSGFRWDFVTRLGELVTRLGVPVVALTGA